MNPNKSHAAQSDQHTVLIVDDHPVVRRGLAALIETDTDLVVCGEAATCHAALELIRDSQPDLVIVDLSLDASDGLDLVKEMKNDYPDIPALVLSMHEEDVYAQRSLRAGAKGYVTKRQLDDAVIIAIRRILAGGTYMSEKLKARLAKKFVDGKTLATDSAIDTLSDRELQVFRLIGQGKTTRQIAERLSLSIKTIESHRGHIKLKMAVKTSAALARRATQWVEK